MSLIEEVPKVQQSPPRCVRCRKRPQTHHSKICQVCDVDLIDKERHPLWAVMADYLDANTEARTARPKEARPRAG